MAAELFPKVPLHRSREGRSTFRHWRASLRNPKAKWAAVALRDEISNLAQDGTISSAYFAWVKQSSNDTLMIDLVYAARRHSVLLAVAFILVVVIAAIVGW